MNEYYVIIYYDRLIKNIFKLRFFAFYTQASLTSRCREGSLIDQWLPGYTLHTVKKILLNILLFNSSAFSRFSESGLTKKQAFQIFIWVHEKPYKVQECPCVLIDSILKTKFSSRYFLWFCNFNPCYQEKFPILNYLHVCVFYIEKFIFLIENRYTKINFERIRATSNSPRNSLSLSHSCFFFFWV